jgi:hypothetical protein
MKIYQLCHTVTSTGHRYYINGKRVSRDDFQLVKFQRRQDCFITRATAKAVRNYSTVYTA